MQEIVGRFVDYIKFDTASDHDSHSCPSTDKQIPFARYLFQELRAVGFQQVTLDENGYIMATLPSNGCEDAPIVGFIAHMDTAPDASGKNVNPRIIKNYDGNDIVLNEAENIVLSTSYFPEILNHKGEDLIVTDGTTLLGADDKAGIAEIITAMEYLMAHPEIKHGKIRVGFNPDEEIGLGAHKFNVELFGCDWAYTMDGGEVGELEYENFNAASAKLTFHGVNVHPGTAKNKMINAGILATEFAATLPSDERPETTEGYEGFYHLTAMDGCVEIAHLNYIIRDHNRETFELRKATVEHLAKQFNEANPGCCEVMIKDQYYNMLEKIEPIMHVIDIAKQAMLEAGVTPKVQPIRGGTDGAQLSFKGLPCPNIFAGGMNMHGRYEYVPVQSMEKAMMTVVNICRIVAE